MKRHAFVLAAGLALGCKGLPSLRPLSEPRHSQVGQRCRTLFPEGSWRATHLVHFHLNRGTSGSFLGVVAVDDVGSGFQAVMLAPEGFTLFDATYSAGQVEVHRAVPPLDASGFGRVMLDDIRLLLLAPDGPLVEIGESDSHEATCRWRRDDGKVVEAILHSPGKTRLRLYADGEMSREALLLGAGRRRFAPEMQLQAYGAVGYRLQLQLLETER
jgi:hypothetical protein